MLFVICRFLNIWLTADNESKTFQSLRVIKPSGQVTWLGEAQQFLLFLPM
jgi:hypothetical protein